MKILKNFKHLKTALLVITAVLVTGGAQYADAGLIASQTKTEVSGTTTNETSVSINDVKKVNLTYPRAIEIGSGKGEAKIVWSTNVPAYSLVVCGVTRGDFDMNKKHFGYTWETKVLDKKVKNHNVQLRNLAEGIHYCRAASRVNKGDEWSVSPEFVFYEKNGIVDSAVAKAEKTNITDNENKDDAGVVTEENKDVNNENEKVNSENDNSDSVAPASLGENVFDSVSCNNEWSVWILVLFALLFVVMWPKDMMANLSAQTSVKRFYVLSVTGVIVFLIALSKNASSWIIPVGIGTMAIVVATIVDIIRSETEHVDGRYSRTVKALLGTLFVTLVFSFIFGWTCSVVPVFLAIVLIAIRYSLLKNKGIDKGEEINKKEV